MRNHPKPTSARGRIVVRQNAAEARAAAKLAADQEAVRLQRAATARRNGDGKART